MVKLVQIETEHEDKDHQCLEQEALYGVQDGRKVIGSGLGVEAYQGTLQRTVEQGVEPKIERTIEHRNPKVGCYGTG